MGIQYHFKGGKIGLHPINFSEDSGKLIGIMGGSGAGKSTLLNVLNGNYTPTIGAVTINGVDIHRDGQRIEGLIGYVSQDDLLIEELTVFQNLFFNAKLCFGNLGDEKISSMVMDTLNAIGLSEAKDLKGRKSVGENDFRRSEKTTEYCFGTHQRAFCHVCG